MTRMLTITGMVLLALPAGLTAQAEARAGAQASVRAESEARGGERSRERSEARQQGRAGAEAVLEATLRAGLPEAPVYRAIAEERARKSPEPVVARAAARVHARLLAAREALSSEGERSPSRMEVSAGAEALARGARRADLARIAKSAPADRSLTTSLETLAELRARGVASSRAAAAISGRLRSGADDRAIASLAAGGELGGTAGRSGLGAAAGVAGGVSGGVGGLLGGGVSGSVGGVLRGGVIP